MSNRSINAGGSIIGGVQNTGDNISVTQSHNQIHNDMKMQAADVDIQQEVAALRELVGQLQTQDRGKIERALADVEEEIAKPDPDKEEVEGAIERAMGYAKKANDYGEIMGKLAATFTPIAVWLGMNADKVSHLLQLSP